MNRITIKGIVRNLDINYSIGYFEYKVSSFLRYNNLGFPNCNNFYGEVCIEPFDYNTGGSIRLIDLSWKRSKQAFHFLGHAHVCMLRSLYLHKA